MANAPWKEIGVSIKSRPVLWSFIALVLLPSFAVTVYFVFLASDQLAAEARFTIRQVESEVREASQNDSDSQNLGNVGATYSFSPSIQNGYVLTNYIESRAIIDDLNKRIDLRAIFRRPEADFWARLKRNASIEELTEYWRAMVGAYIDAPSGIITIRVKAFRAADAVTLASAILDLSEALVNRISERARHDAMSLAQDEVRRTYGMTRAALADLRQFRDDAGIIDPVQAGTDIGKLLLALVNERIQLESELFVVGSNLEDSAPTVKALRARLESAERQIAELKGQLTGGGQRTLASSLAKFEELELQRQFSEKLYVLAQANLDRARQRADRQTLYLTVFVRPDLPEEARYPRRFAFSALFFLGLTILWSIGAMIIASVEDHRL